MKTFPESKLAHKYLDGLIGLEIGGSIHNPFGLNTKNVDYSDSNETTFKKEEYDMYGDYLPVDIVAFGDNIPVADESYDFIVSSHVLEHFPDPIKALKEWYRIIKKGGYIFAIIPHKERTFDRGKKRTTFEELLSRYNNRGYDKEPSMQGHYSFWITEDIIELVKNIDLEWQVIDFQNVDDKVGNGFTVVIKKNKIDPIIQKKIEGRIKRIKNYKLLLQKLPKIIKKIFEMMENLWHNFERGGIPGVLKKIMSKQANEY